MERRGSVEKNRAGAVGGTAFEECSALVRSEQFRDAELEVGKPKSYMFRALAPLRIRDESYHAPMFRQTRSQGNQGIDIAATSDCDDVNIHACLAAWPPDRLSDGSITNAIRCFLSITELRASHKERMAAVWRVEGASALTHLGDRKVR
jgi:hypothetical protein